MWEFIDKMNQQDLKKLKNKLAIMRETAEQIPFDTMQLWLEDIENAENKIAAIIQKKEGG